MLILLASLAACFPTTVKLPPDSADPSTDDTGADDSGADDTGADDSGADDSGADDSAVDTSPVDADGDGSPRSEDCDDNNDRVYPGAEEVFDGWDNDCDGVTDANGDYSGTLRVDARASYQGDTYDFRLRCPMEMSRTLSDFTLLVVCETDPSDEYAALLLGSRVEMAPEDPYCWEHERWEGRMEITSSNGWDTFADGALEWTNLSHANLSVTLNATWLSMDGSGELNRSP